MLHVPWLSFRRVEHDCGAYKVDQKEKRNCCAHETTRRVLAPCHPHAQQKLEEPHESKDCDGFNRSQLPGFVILTVSEEAESADYGSDKHDLGRQVQSFSRPAKLGVVAVADRGKPTVELERVAQKTSKCLMLCYLLHLF